MPNPLIFADEAGNFDFSRKPGATRYFILTTVVLWSPQVALDLTALRWKLAAHEYTVEGAFHAATDRQAVRDRVFEMLSAHEFRIDATILEKCKTYPKYHHDPVAFYQLAWHLHWKYIAPRVLSPRHHPLVVAGTLTTQKKKAAYEAAIASVVRQVSGLSTVKVLAWPDVADPGIQVADYCAWAIQRKWERQDTRSYVHIEPKIGSEFPVFDVGVKEVY